jgi:8-oxo-dGTP pyrophosphatase MutT (NUDIX family)
VSRDALSSLLERYGRAHPAEAGCAERMRALLRARPDCFERSCLPGHFTASAWIASADRRRFLLAHHRKLDRWLQLGGHADGDPDLLAVALREAREESGMGRFAQQPGPAGLPVLDVDIHEIPARAGEPAHAHYDVRFLLVAEPGQPLRVSAESKALRWLELERLEEWVREESLLRLGRKARRALEAVA